MTKAEFRDWIAARWNACGEAWAMLLTKLNALGSIALAFLLAYPNALNELLAQLPPAMRDAVPGIVPLLWFALVQVAKAKAIAGKTDARR